MASAEDPDKPDKHVKKGGLFARLGRRITRAFAKKPGKSKQKYSKRAKSTANLEYSVSHEGRLDSPSSRDSGLMSGLSRPDRCVSEGDLMTADLYTSASENQTGPGSMDELPTPPPWNLCGSMAMQSELAAKLQLRNKTVGREVPVVKVEPVRGETESGETPLAFDPFGPVSPQVTKLDTSAARARLGAGRPRGRKSSPNTSNTSASSPVHATPSPSNTSGTSSKGGSTSQLDDIVEETKEENARPVPVPKPRVTRNTSSRLPGGVSVVNDQLMSRFKQRSLDALDDTVEESKSKTLPSSGIVVDLKKRPSEVADRAMKSAARAPGLLKKPTSLSTSSVNEEPATSSPPLNRPSVKEDRPPVKTTDLAKSLKIETKESPKGEDKASPTKAISGTPTKTDSGQVRSPVVRADSKKSPPPVSPKPVRPRPAWFPGTPASHKSSLLKTPDGDTPKEVTSSVPESERTSPKMAQVPLKSSTPSLDKATPVADAMSHSVTLRSASVDQSVRNKRKSFEFTSNNTEKAPVEVKQETKSTPLSKSNTHIAASNHAEPVQLRENSRNIRTSVSGMQRSSLHSPVQTSSVPSSAVVPPQPDSTPNKEVVLRSRKSMTLDTNHTVIFDSSADESKRRSVDHVGDQFMSKTAEKRSSKIMDLMKNFQNPQEAH